MPAEKNKMELLVVQQIDNSIFSLSYENESSKRHGWRKMINWVPISINFVPRSFWMGCFGRVNLRSSKTNPDAEMRPTDTLDSTTVPSRSTRRRCVAKRKAQERNKVGVSGRRDLQLSRRPLKPDFVVIVLQMFKKAPHLQRVKTGKLGRKIKNCNHKLLLFDPCSFILQKSTCIRSLFHSKR